MGLDIYFSRVERAKKAELEPQIKQLKEQLEPIDEKLNELTYGTEEYNKVYKEYDDIQDKIDELVGQFLTGAGSFRKVNFLVHFFEYVENQTDLVISKDQIEDLVEACGIVLNTRKSINEKIAYCEKCKKENAEYKEKYEHYVRRIAELTEELENTCKLYLPTISGFFFGSTYYDQDYFENVAEVKEHFSKLLKTTDFDTTDIEMYCWW